MDSLQKISREFPDSALRNIADICLEADSTLWRTSVRNDSLKNVLRLWTPAGLADNAVMSLGITRVPFYLVISETGNQIFRGEEMEMAFEAFRKLMRDTVSSPEISAEDKKGV